MKNGAARKIGMARNVIGAASLAHRHNRHGASRAKYGAARIMA